MLKKFEEAKQKFYAKIKDEEGSKVMQKVIGIINDLGINWATYTGGEFAERQMKLAGYKFYLSEHVSELLRISEQLKLEVKEIRASRWEDIAEMIKQEKGKDSNKEQIENIILLETKELQTQQIFYETSYYKIKLQLDAIGDILTAIVQRIADKKREIEMSKTI